MDLNWDKNVMIKARDNLLKKDFLSEVEKCHLKFYNQNIEGKVSVTKKAKDLTEKEMIDALEELVYEYKDFINCKADLSIQFKNLIEGLKYLVLDFDYKDIDIDNSKITSRELVEKSYEIFGNISPGLIKYLDFIYNNNLVKMVFHKTRESSSCETDVFNKLGFVFAQNDDDYSSESMMNHELAHSIITTTNGEFYYLNCGYLTEFNSSFMGIYTDKYLYEKTKDIKYLHSYYNLLLAYQWYIYKFALINEISKIKGDLTKEKIEKQLINNYVYNYKDFNALAMHLINYYDFKNILYLIGSCCAFNMFENDLKDVKKMYTNTFFQEYKSYEDFFKSIDFDYKNPYIALDIFNKETVEVKQMIRKLEKDKK